MDETENSDLESIVGPEQPLEEGYPDGYHEEEPVVSDAPTGTTADDAHSVRTVGSVTGEALASPSGKGSSKFDPNVEPDTASVTDGEDDVTPAVGVTSEVSLKSTAASTIGPSQTLGSADKVQIKSMLETLMGEAEELALHPSKSLFTSSELGLRSKKDVVHSEGYQQLKVLYDHEQSEFASKMPSVMELYAAEVETGLTLNDFAWPKFALDDPDQVYENLLAMTVINPSLCVIQGERAIIRKDHYESMMNKVKIIIGGPAGNEPLFSGYVGKGMATAAVIGDRKNVPKSLAIYKTIKELALHHSCGILLIIPNTLECRIVFGLAMERARSEGSLVDMIVVADDCCDHVVTKTGRRTLAGFVLALKVAGAMSEEEKTMKEIYLMVRSLLIVSISAHVNDANVFIGTGVKDGGYPIKCVCNDYEEDCQKQPTRGCATKTHNTLRHIVESMMDFATGYKRYFSLPLKPFSQIVVLINCYTEDKLFLYSALAEVLRQIYCHDVAATRVYAGTFVSSRRGFSITFLKVINEEVYYWLDYPTEVDVWPPPRDRTGGIISSTRGNRKTWIYPGSYYPGFGASVPSDYYSYWVLGPLQAGTIPVVTKSIHDMPVFNEKRSFGPKFTNREQIFIPFIISAIAEDLTITEAVLNDLDPDKTLGTCLVKGFKGVAAANKSQQLDYTRPYNLFHQLALIFEDASCGVLASFTALFFGAIANEFLKYSENTELEYRMYGSALIEAAKAIRIYAKINADTEAYIGDVCIPGGKFLIDIPPEVQVDEVLDNMFKLCKKSISQARLKPAGTHHKGKEEGASVAFLFCLKSIIRARKKVTF